MNATRERPSQFLKVSLFLAAGASVLLAFARDDLPQHDDAVAVHECHPGEALAVFEGITDQWLLRLEAALCHLIGLQRVGIFHFLTPRLFAHLPLELRDAAG